MTVGRQAVSPVAVGERGEVLDHGIKRRQHHSLELLDLLFWSFFIGGADDLRGVHEFVAVNAGAQHRVLAVHGFTFVGPGVEDFDRFFRVGFVALDPVSADKILALTRGIVGEGHITTLMITHNMTSAIKTGTRLLMMDEGTLAVDISGQERENLSVSDLLERFSRARGKTFDSDRTLLG